MSDPNPDQPNTTTDDLNSYILAATIVFLSLSLTSTVLLIIYARSRWAGRGQLVDDPETRGLDPGIVSSLPVRAFELDNEHGKCVVCLSDFVDGEKMKVLPDCGHGFHVDCVDTWFKSKSTCPLCRKPVREREPVVPVGSTRGSGEGLPVNVLFWGTREGGVVSNSGSGSGSESSGVKGSPRCCWTEVDLEMGEVACR